MLSHELGRGDSYWSQARVWALLPDERVREAPRRIDLSKLAAKLKGLSGRRLHRDVVPPAFADVDLETRRGEARQAPPLSELLRLDARREDAPGRCVQDLLQVEGEACGSAIHVGSIAPLGAAATRVGITGLQAREVLEGGSREWAVPASR